MNEGTSVYSWVRAHLIVKYLELCAGPECRLDPKDSIDAVTFAVRAINRAWTNITQRNGTHKDELAGEALNILDETIAHGIHGEADGRGRMMLFGEKHPIDLPAEWLEPSVRIVQRWLAAGNDVSALVRCIESETRKAVDDLFNPGGDRTTRLGSRPRQARRPSKDDGDVFEALYIYGPTNNTVVSARKLSDLLKARLDREAATKEFDDHKSWRSDELWTSSVEETVIGTFDTDEDHLEDNADVGWDSPLADKSLGLLSTVLRNSFAVVVRALLQYLCINHSRTVGRSAP
jgi:hypothetical protein